MSKGLIINEDKWMMIEALTLHEQALLIASLAAYHRGEELPKMDRIVQMVFDQICLDNAKFDPENKRSLSEIRSAAGKKGVEAKQANASKSKQNEQNEANYSKRSKNAQDKEEDKEEDKDIDIEKENPPTGGKRKSPKTFADLFADCPEINQDFVKEAWESWLEVRMKYPWTERASVLNANNLKRFSKGDPIRAVKILETAIERGWRGLYDLDDKPKQNRGKVLDWDSVVV